jgi:hypothetical protein
MELDGGSVVSGNRREMLRCARFLRQGRQDDGNNNDVNCKSDGNGKGPAEAGRFEKPGTAFEADPSLRFGMTEFFFARGGLLVGWGGRE